METLKHLSAKIKLLNQHLRRIVLIVLNLMMNHDIVFRILGKINNRYNFLESVFLCYPASDKYFQAYAYPFFQKFCSWTPYITGIILQDSKWTLTFAISNMEDEFVKAGNSDKLKQLVERMENIRKLVGAGQKTFAGILPGVLLAKRYIRETHETKVTIEAIVKAEESVRKAEKIGGEVPLIILGGKGFIGRRLCKRLEGREIHCVDITKRHFANSWPVHLAEKTTIIINVTRKTALRDYLDKFWPELILLNEVYPEPCPYEIEKLTSLGSPVYHIVGIDGKAYPSFPGAYKTGIPCCAGRKTENLRCVIKKLNNSGFHWNSEKM